MTTRNLQEAHDVITTLLKDACRIVGGDCAVPEKPEVPPAVTLGLENIVNAIEKIPTATYTSENYSDVHGVYLAFLSEIEPLLGASQQTRDTSVESLQRFSSTWSNVLEKMGMKQHGERLMKALLSNKLTEAEEILAAMNSIPKPKKDKK